MINSLRVVGITLALITGQAWAQAGELYDADVTEQTAISDPAKAIKQADGKWLAFSLPVMQGTHSPCCWKGKWNNMGEVGCSLGSSHQSYGARSDSPLTDNVIVFSEIKNGQVETTRVVGESCPVTGEDAKVTWIGTVDEKAGLDWLVSTARSDDSTLYALGLHRSNKANARLYQLAMEKDGDISEEAIFWLGEARGEAGLETLEKLLDDLPPGETRRHINFAVSQNNAAGAADLLLEIYETDQDSEQRSDALFWFAQEYPQRAEKVLLGVVANERDEDVVEQAVFAISQLPGESGSKMLMDLVTDSQAPREVRRQALFWLANSDDDNAVAALADLLSK
jgi:hypothetical protein